MASIRCEQCSELLTVPADGSSAVCPKCGQVYSSDKIQSLLKKQNHPGHGPEKAAEQEALQACRRGLQELVDGKCDAAGAKKIVADCMDQVEALTDEQKLTISRDLAAAIGSTAFNLKIYSLWRPYLQGIQRCSDFFTEKLYHAVMSQALDCVADFILSPMEKAIVDWHRQTDANKTESGAIELLRKCNSTTEEALHMVGFALADHRDVDFERSLTDLFERLDRMSWDMSEIPCCRPLAEDPGKYERYSFFSTSSYLPDKTALTRNRSIVENRSNQMKRQAEQLRQQRIDAYWQEHPEKKAALQVRWADLRMQIAALRRKLNLCPQIGRMQEIQRRLNVLQPQLAALSIFRQRERSTLKEEQNALKQEFAQLDQEFMELDMQTRSQISVLEEELKRVSLQLEGHSDECC